MEFEFTGSLIEWRGPAPFFFVRLPDPVGDEIGDLAPELTYGWGVIPVTATVGRTTFTTSLFPREGGYLLPLKVAVRRAENIGETGSVAVTLRIGAASP